MPWAKGNSYAGFSEEKPWLPLGQGHPELAAALQESSADSVLNFTRRMLAVREGSAALRLGDVQFPDVPAPLLAIRRDIAGESVIALFNLGREAVSVPPELVGGHVALITSGAGAESPAQLSGHGVWIGQRKG